MNHERIREALNSVEPVEHLCRLAINFNKEGLGKKEIYEIFYSYYLALEATNPIHADYLFDVLDMITGWYIGKNFDLND